MVTAEITSDWGELIDDLMYMRGTGNIFDYTDFACASEVTNISNYRVNDDDTPMQLAIITDKMIEDNSLKCVSDPIMFESGKIPTPKGLYSETIFGTTPEEKQKNHAYIDLGGTFIHPYVYEVLVSLQRSIAKIVEGEGSWKVGKDGKLIEIPDNSPDYDEDATGLDWFINNFDKIIFESNDSFMRKERLRFINALSKEEIFISKWIVIPVAYRDYDTSSKNVKKKPEITEIYNKIISYSNRLRNEGNVSFFANKTKAAIQKLLVQLRKLGQSKIESKGGHLHRAVMGKNVIYGARYVISVPIEKKADHPDDTMVDIVHCGVPLSACIYTGYPFIARWINEFFRREFDPNFPKPIRVKDSKDEIKYVRLKDPMLTYTPDYVHKKLDEYCNNYGGRFEPIMVTTEEGEEVAMVFTGMGYTGNPNDPGAATISNRKLTWTDLVYQAAVQTLSDKHVYITRYPLTDYFGVFPSKIRPVSTIETTQVTIDGRYYPFYPVVIPEMPYDQVSTRFIDTVTMSNLMLKGCGGDYDGDQITIKMVYTEEANDEADRLMKSLKYFMKLDGSMVRVIGNELGLTTYNMTRRR